MRKSYRGLPMIWQTSPGWDVPSQFRSFKRPTLAQPWRRRNVVFKTAKQQMVTSMQIPAEIPFHNIEASDSIEDAIRDHIARLEHIYDRMTTCRVRGVQRTQNANCISAPGVHFRHSVPG